jgi:hypothetical protein
MLKVLVVGAGAQGGPLDIDEKIIKRTVVFWQK